MDWSRKHVVEPKPEFGLKQQPHRKRERERKNAWEEGSELSRAAPQTYAFLFNH